MEKFHSGRDKFRCQSPSGAKMCDLLVQHFFGNCISLNLTREHHSKKTTNNTTTTEMDVFLHVFEASDQSPDARAFLLLARDYMTRRLGPQT